MRIFGYEIMKGKEADELLSIKKDIGRIIAKKLPMVFGRTLQGKTISLPKGAVFVGCAIFENRIKGFGELKVLGYNTVISCNVFNKKEKEVKNHEAKTSIRSLQRRRQPMVLQA